MYVPCTHSRILASVIRAGQFYVNNAEPSDNVSLYSVSVTAIVQCRCHCTVPLSLYSAAVIVVSLPLYSHCLCIKQFVMTTATNSNAAQCRCSLCRCFFNFAYSFSVGYHCYQLLNVRRVAAERDLHILSTRTRAETCSVLTLNEIINYYLDEQNALFNSDLFINKLLLVYTGE